MKWKQEKNLRTAIKQFLSPDLNILDYAIWGVLEKKKTNAISHPNVGSLKTVIKEEWNKTSKELILKTCKIILKTYWDNNWKNGNPIE